MRPCQWTSLHHSPDKPNLFGAAAPSVAPGSCLSTTETSLSQVSVPWDSLGLVIESPDLPLNNSLVAKAVSGDEPEQIHLAIGASVAEMYVTWLTGKASCKASLVMGKDEGQTVFELACCDPEFTSTQAFYWLTAQSAGTWCLSAEHAKPIGPSFATLLNK